MVTYIHVRAINQQTSTARLSLGATQFPCWIGRAGLAHRKREGDGKTPIGVWFLDQPFYRSDRLRAIKTGLVFRPLQQNMGWCESPGSQHYNCKVLLPFRGAHESMWRDDNAYDIVISTSHNKRPRVRGLGSAIFFHLLREGADATAGCVALRLADMRKILSRCGPVAALVVWPPNSQFRSLPRTARCQL